MFLWVGSDGKTGELEPQTQAEELLFDHSQLESDPRRENDYYNWLDEIIEVETALIATYIDQYDIPEWMADLIKDHDHSDEQFQGIVAELKRGKEFKDTKVKDTAVTA